MSHGVAGGSHTSTEGERAEFANKAEGFHEISKECSEVIYLIFLLLQKYLNL